MYVRDMFWVKEAVGPWSIRTAGGAECNPLFPSRVPSGGNATAGYASLTRPTSLGRHCEPPTFSRSVSGSSRGGSSI
jgi:hypothetical protein